MRKGAYCLLVLVLFLPAAHAAVVTFDDNPLSPESHWGGTGSGETGFTSGNASFPHVDGGFSWNGFLYSNRTDTTTPGFGNQYSAITGGGVNRSANYGIGFIPLDFGGGTYLPIPQAMSFTGDDFNAPILGGYFSNTTFAYLAMRDGDSFTEKFGGAGGNDPDWLKLIIKGVDVSGDYTGTVDFFLADYRFDDNSKDYIVDDWTWVDLTSLGNVAGLEFSIDSSDKGAFGINTPAYFAMDNLTVVPIPGAIWLLGTGLAGLLCIRRRLAVR